jgi:hypothetical protein
MEAPPIIEDSIEIWSAFPFGPPIEVRRGGIAFGKTHGIKARCYLKKPWGTHWELWEHIGNLMGTY